MQTAAAEAGPQGWSSQPEPVVQPIQPEPVVQPIQPEPVVQPIQPEPVVQPIQPEPVVQLIQPEPVVQRNQAMLALPQHQSPPRDNNTNTWASSDVTEAAPTDSPTPPPSTHPPPSSDVNGDARRPPSGVSSSGCPGNISDIWESTIECPGQLPSAVGWPPAAGADERRATSLQSVTSPDPEVSQDTTSVTRGHLTTTSVSDSRFDSLADASSSPECRRALVELRLARRCVEDAPSWEELRRLR